MHVPWLRVPHHFIYQRQQIFWGSNVWPHLRTFHTNWSDPSDLILAWWLIYLTVTSSSKQTRTLWYLSTIRKYLRPRWTALIPAHWCVPASQWGKLPWWLTPSSGVLLPDWPLSRDKSSKELGLILLSLRWGCTSVCSIWGLASGWWHNFESSLSPAALNELLSTTQASLAVAASSQNSLHTFASQAKWCSNIWMPWLAFTMNLVHADELCCVFQ